MNARQSIIFLLVASIGLGRLSPCAVAADPLPQDTYPPAEQLLAEVIARFPLETLEVSGALIVRRHRGVVVREVGFEMELAFGKTPPTTHYRIYDALGKELETLSVYREGAELPRMAYAVGGVLRDDPPNMFSRIQSSDVTWMDLTLSFLWWHGGKVVRTESIKDRSCFVVEIESPESLGVVTERGYAKVLLWIDMEMRMLLQAEGQNARGEPMRRLWVKSLKKIDDRWMIKDMEVQQFPATHRTKLHVRDVKAPEEL